MSNLPTETQQRLEGMLKGDPATIKGLYEENFGVVAHLIRKNNGTDMDAEDVFQEALIVLYRKAKQADWQLNYSIGSYLVGICRNLWLKHLEKRRKLPQKDAAVLEQMPQEENELHLQAMKERLFSEHLSKMGDNCRQILQWFFAKVSMKEMAQRLKSTEAYVKKRKHICKKRLIHNIETDPQYQLHFRSV